MHWMHWLSKCIGQTMTNPFDAAIGKKKNVLGTYEKFGNIFDYNRWLSIAPDVKNNYQSSTVLSLFIARSLLLALFLSPGTANNRPQSRLYHARRQRPFSGIGCVIAVYGSCEFLIGRARFQRIDAAIAHCINDIVAGVDGPRSG